MHPDRIEDLLIQLYGAEQAHQIIAELKPYLVEFERRLAVGTTFYPHTIDHRDAILITYADQVCQLGEAPLETLNRFAERYVRASFSGMHILPFFPVHV
jgi:hypothetical protein